MNNYSRLDISTQKPQTLESFWEPNLKKNKATIKMSDDEYVKFLKTMLTIRSFEEVVRKLHLTGKAMGLIHLCTGQEAVSTGFISELNPDDYISVYHRAHGHFLAKGSKPELILAELTHKKPGFGMGRSGEPHMNDASTNNLGSTGIVGGMSAIATGAAFTAKLKKTSQVTLCFFGDGALNQGLLFESMNMAAIWNLPIVYICENNQYGEFTESATVTAGEYLNRGAMFNIASEKIDGMDVLEVNKTAKKAIDRARSGDGPSFIVCETYRYSGHHVSDTQDYKDKTERETWEARDPVPNYSQWLIDNGHATSDQIQQLKIEADKSAENAAILAENMPGLTSDDLMEHVYAP